MTKPSTLPVPLPNLLRGLELLSSSDIENIPIRDIHFDSRQVTTGSLFVAFQGLRKNGHDYIEQALVNGATALVVERPPSHLSLPRRVPVAHVPDGRRALSVLAANFYGHPSRKLKVVGVTGTNGKTTSTFMLDTIFQESGYRTGLLGSLLKKIDRHLSTSGITTPDAPQLHRALMEMVKAGVTYATIEVSSHGLLFHRVADVHFEAAGITNITEDHPDIHPNQEHYIRVKSRLFQQLPPGKTALLNLDDAGAACILPCAGKHRLTYGLHDPNADLKAEALVLGPYSSRFDLIFSGHANEFLHPGAPTRVTVELKAPGIHNIYNALLAAAAALACGLPLESIVSGLRTFQGIPRRMQVVYNGKFQVIDDFAHNPASLEAVFNCLNHKLFSNLLLVHAIRGNRGEKINRANARTIAMIGARLGFKEIISTDSSDCVQEKDRVCDSERTAFIEELQKAGFRIHHESLLSDAIRRAIKTAGKGDLVLLTGAQGMDQGATIVNQILQGEGEKGRTQNK